MIKKITYLFLLMSGICLGQTTDVNDFETGSAAPLDKGGAIEFEVTTNPNQSGINTSDNVLKISRTGGTPGNNWWAFIGIDVDDLAISSSDTKFISMMVLYDEQPDLAIRLGATSDAANGPGGNQVLRALNTYTTPGQWQEIIFEVRDNTSETGTSYTNGTLYRIDLHPDVGYQNTSQAFVLSTTSFGYVDNIKVISSNPLSTKDFSLNNSVSIYPNEVNSTFTVKIKDNISISKIDMFNILGKNITNNVVKISRNKYDISNLSKGMYIARIYDTDGNFATKKIIKK